MFLTTKQVELITFHLEQRGKVSAGKDNPHVFARKMCNFLFNACVVPKEGDYASVATQPELLLAPLLRKYTATTVQALNFTENDEVTLITFWDMIYQPIESFIGFSIKQQISPKCLMATGDGSVEKLQGKNFDEINVNG